VITAELTVRLPVAIYHRLRYLAQREGRQLPAQAEALIEQALETIEPRKDEDPPRKFSRTWRRRL
jgi:predicted DNA-binding protein